jgi:hypothetical protein
MTQEEMDKKEFEECCKKYDLYPHQKFTFDVLKIIFMESRRLLREKEGKDGIQN